MVCPKCSSVNPDNVRFCGQCGSGLQVSLDDAQTLMLDQGRAATPSVSRTSRTAAGLISPPPEGSSDITWGAIPAVGVPPASLQPGTAFGTRYRIEALLGEGGMGAVYRALDLELERTVALKLVRPELAGNAQTMARFKQELLLASRISHKNILRIHDLGDWNGIKYISMAFVEGCDLAALIEKEGRMPLDRVLKFTRQMCAALEAAHHEGVVHRDLKPQNILIDGADNIYVSDFGLAKSLESATNMMTRTGQILGTPRYMSPEQVEAREVDHRSDLYSLGLIVYEMLTAELPFRGDSAMQLMYQRVTEPPKDPRLARPDLPSYMAEVILKCLEKDPARRYQSACEIVDDLDAQQARTTGSPARVGAQTISIQIPKPTRRTGLLAAAILVLMVGAAVSLPPVRHWFARTPASSPANTQPAYYLAVLPFKVVGDDSSRYLADGIVDSLTAKLSGLHYLYVAPQSGVNAALSQPNDSAIAHALGVGLLVKGTVQSAGDRISVVIAMDDTAASTSRNRHLPPYRREFSGDRRDLLTLEDQMFQGIAAGLGGALTSEDRARTAAQPTQDIDAYDLYLKGQNLLRGRQNAKNSEAALNFFNDAIKRDPNFALAYTGVADSSLRLYSQTNDSVWTTRALGAAQHAESLNPNLPEVHFSLGSIYTAIGRTNEAIAQLKEALKLAPNSDDGLRRLGSAYMKANRQQDAIQALAEATRVNPYLWTNFNSLGRAYFKIGENEKALAAVRKVTEIDPGNPTGWSNVGAAYYRLGNWSASVTALQKAIALDPSPFYHAQLGTAYFFMGRYADAAGMFEIAVQKSPASAAYQMDLADAYRWAGQPDKAAAGYDRAIAQALKDLDVNPRNAESLGILAVSYAKKRDDSKASTFIHQARQIDSKDTDLMYKEATIHALAGRTPDAIAVLKQALENGYNREEARSDPELKDLRQSPEFARMQRDLAAVPQRP